MHCPNMKLAKKIQIEEDLDFGHFDPSRNHRQHVNHGGCRPSFALPRRKEDSSPIVCETFLTMFNLSRPFYMSSASNKYGFPCAHTTCTPNLKSITKQPIHNCLKIYLPTTGRFKRNNCNNNRNHCQKNNRNNTRHRHHLSIQYFQLHPNMIP